MAYARFATRINESASNNDQGGLAITLDWSDGVYKGKFRGLPMFWGASGVAGFENHPDTGLSLDGKPIPKLNIIDEGLQKICRYLSSLDFFGFDVIITEEGFKLCDINSAPSMEKGQFLWKRIP